MIFFKHLKIWLAILILSSGLFVLGLHESSWTSLVNFFGLLMRGWGRWGLSSSRRCWSSCSAKIWAVPLCVLLLALENLSCWWFGCWEMNDASSDSFQFLTGRKVEIVYSGCCWSAGLVSWCELTEKKPTENVFPVPTFAPLARIFCAIQPLPGFASSCCEAPLWSVVWIFLLGLLAEGLGIQPLPGFASSRCEAPLWSVVWIFLACLSSVCTTRKKAFCFSVLVHFSWLGLLFSKTCIQARPTVAQIISTKPG